jgi:GT2 family glycosyltransferase
VDEILLTACVVLYNPRKALIDETLESLRTAAFELEERDVRLVIVNNGGAEAVVNRETLTELFPRLSWIEGQGNVGFGAGHNLGLRDISTRYVLVLNPDVRIEPDALSCAIRFMETHPECGLLAPRVTEDEGTLQYLCKRPPTVFDLFLRGLAPAGLRRFFWRRLARYEMRDVLKDGEVIVWDPPIVSGCFMLFRNEVYKRLSGFDEQYFLYFEDFDISLRASKCCRLAYVPAVRIVHHGGEAGKKGRRHVRLFIRSAITFFRSHGWRLA